LVDNALHYGKQALISVTDGPERLVIGIRDTGPGIPEAELERVFEPFYRLEGSRSRHTGGTGLGLGIARNIARAHGGELTLRNRQQGGLEARLELPR
jgi:signal transduction histidine kinase